MDKEMRARRIEFYVTVSFSTNDKTFRENKIRDEVDVEMGLGWDSVLKFGAFGVCLVIAIQVISYFVGISYDSFSFSLQLVIAVLVVIAFLVAWRIIKRSIAEPAS